MVSSKSGHEVVISPARIDQSFFQLTNLHSMLFQNFLDLSPMKFRWLLLPCQHNIVLVVVDVMGLADRGNHDAVVVSLDYLELAGLVGRQRS